jgi:hypothetical protein
MSSSGPGASVVPAMSRASSANSGGYFDRLPRSLPIAGTRLSAFERRTMPGQGHGDKKSGRRTGRSRSLTRR